MQDGGTHLKKQCILLGFYFTGQVDIESRITVTAKGPVKGVTSGREEYHSYKLQIHYSLLYLVED